MSLPFLLSPQDFHYKKESGLKPISIMSATKTIYRKYLIRFGVIVLLLFLFNIISTRLHRRIDLTAENRFSLSDPTKKLLKSLKEPVIIEVYLKGKFPSGFQRLAESVNDVLNEFQEDNNIIAILSSNPSQDAYEQYLYPKAKSKSVDYVIQHYNTYFKPILPGDKLRVPL